jgi:hypothetical protein
MENVYSLPEDVLSALVSKVTQSFLEGIISKEEAASRLVGTGKFDSNSAALEYINQEVVPQIMQKIAVIDEEIQALQEKSAKLRVLAGLSHAKTKEMRQPRKIKETTVPNTEAEATAH